MSAKELIMDAITELDHTRDKLMDNFFYLSPSAKDTQYGEELENHIDCITDALHLLDLVLDLIEEDD